MKFLTTFFLLVSAFLVSGAALGKQMSVGQRVGFQGDFGYYSGTIENVLKPKKVSVNLDGALNFKNRIYKMSELAIGYKCAMNSVLMIMYLFLVN